MVSNSRETITLDVRPLTRRGQTPLLLVLNTLNTLKPNQKLKVIANAPLEALESELRYRNLHYEWVPRPSGVNELWIWN